MPNLVYFNYEWDYWQLYHKVTFDGPNRLILINEGETSLVVLDDIYSAWKEWIQYDNDAAFNAGYTQALAVTGGDPLPGGESLDATFFLVNNWKLKPYSGNYTLNIDGNLFSVDGSAIAVPADGTQNNITISLFSSAIVRRLGTIADSIDTTKIDEVWKIHGLDLTNPMIVSPTERSAGLIIQQTFTEDDPVPGSITTRRI